MAVNAARRRTGAAEGTDSGTPLRRRLAAADSGGETLAPSGERAIRNIAWGIADMDEADAAFKAAGAPTLVEPFAVNEVVKVAFCQDPNGVSVERL
ncbi:MAG: hypothetical protein OSB03_09665 [Vicinamibacterales bacterium]|nr:hypothetical protein [Vicinamibacterales bacterium]